jgi:uncharacterized protein (DUF433 family)
MAAGIKLARPGGDLSAPDCATIGPMTPAISRDPEIMHGAPVFRGTRVPVQTMFDYLEGGETLEDFLAGFPTVSRELALQALEEAKRLLLANV